MIEENLKTVYTYVVMVEDVVFFLSVAPSRIPPSSITAVTASVDIGLRPFAL